MKPKLIATSIVFALATYITSTARADSLTPMAPPVKYDAIKIKMKDGGDAHLITTADWLNKDNLKKVEMADYADVKDIDTLPKGATVYMKSRDQRVYLTYSKEDKTWTTSLAFKGFENDGLVLVIKTAGGAIEKPTNPGLKGITVEKRAMLDHATARDTNVTMNK